MARVSVPKRRRRQTIRRKPLTIAEPKEGEGAEPAGGAYETNVSPDLIEAGRSPIREEVIDPECSLPVANDPAPD